jgi:cytochrome c-type biogenesis protein CcmH
MPLNRLLSVCGLLGLLLLSPAQARVEAVQFDTPRQEALYNELILELRCLVCANQSLSDSNAELAQDLRRKTAEMVQRGEDRESIVKYMVDRYGEFVLYKPRLTTATVFLWFGPFVVFLLVAFLVARFIRSQSRQPRDTPDPDRLEEARSLLDDEKEP